MNASYKNTAPQFPQPASLGCILASLQEYCLVLPLLTAPPPPRLPPFPVLPGSSFNLLVFMGGWPRNGEESAGSKLGNLWSGPSGPGSLWASLSSL